MRILGKIDKVSMYAGDTALDGTDLFIKPGTQKIESTGMIKTTLKSIYAVYRKIAGYIEEDICRSAFLLCLFAIATSAATYNLGYLKKLHIQRYLIQLEGELEKERQTEKLFRNIEGLDMLFSAVAAGSTAKDLHGDAVEYIFNIKTYFLRNASNTLEDFYQKKAGGIEKGIKEGLLESISVSANRNFTDKKNDMFIKNYRHDLSLLLDYADERKKKIYYNIDQLERDSRKALVGGVPLYNTMMDFSFLVGVIFLILGIASIPGLGRHVRTGFV